MKTLNFFRVYTKRSEPTDFKTGYTDLILLTGIKLSDSGFTDYLRV